MLDSTQIKARELIVEQIDKVIEKYSKKSDKEKNKKNNAYVVYQGEKYYSDADLQDAYACDAFTSATYDRLIDKLNKARGNVESYELTPSQILVMELEHIRNNFTAELIHDKKEKEHQVHIDSRMKELVDEGYSIREAETIVGNEELMRYE